MEQKVHVIVHTHTPQPLDSKTPGKNDPLSFQTIQVKQDITKNIKVISTGLVDLGKDLTKANFPPK